MCHTSARTQLNPLCYVKENSLHLILQILETEGGSGRGQGLRNRQKINRVKEEKGMELQRKVIKRDEGV